MALANVYGMVMVMSFLGHGLVDFPRSLWKKSFLESYLKSLEFEAPILRDEVDDHISEYNDAKSVIFIQTISLYCSIIIC